MNTDNKTKLDPVVLGFELNSQLPITSYAKSVVNAMCDEPHAHPRAQLIYANKGVMKVVTPNQVWVVNPLQGIWVPGMTIHQVYFPNNVEIKTLFVDPSAAKDLPKKCFAFTISAFLKELIGKIVSYQNQSAPVTSERRVMDVMLDELKLITPSILFLPTSNDVRIEKVLNGIIRDLSDNRTLEDYAKIACVSTRTLSRLFVSEMGMTFNEWRTRLKVMEAIKRLGEKQSVTTIAIDLGYESTSAFIAMFRKQVGSTPSNYISIG